MIVPEPDRTVPCHSRGRVVPRIKELAWMANGGISRWLAIVTVRMDSTLVCPSRRTCYPPASMAFVRSRTADEIRQRPPRRDHSDARYVERHVCSGIADSGENPAPGFRVCVSDRGAAALGKTGTGATESVRPGGAADAVEHRAECHHWRRQQRDWRDYWRDFPAGHQLSGGALSVQTSDSGSID